MNGVTHNDFSGKVDQVEMPDMDFWQQILRYHHRTIALDNVRLVKLAMVDGFALHQTAVKDSCNII